MRQLCDCRAGSRAQARCGKRTLPTWRFCQAPWQTSCFFQTLSLCCLRYVANACFKYRNYLMLQSPKPPVPAQTSIASSICVLLPTLYFLSFGPTEVYKERGGRRTSVCMYLPPSLLLSIPLLLASSPLPPSSPFAFSFLVHLLPAYKYIRHVLHKKFGSKQQMGEQVLGYPQEAEMHPETFL